MKVDLALLIHRPRSTSVQSPFPINEFKEVVLSKKNMKVPPYGIPADIYKQVL